MSAKELTKAVAKFTYLYNILIQCQPNISSEKCSAAIAAVHRQFSLYFPQLLKQYEVIIQNKGDFHDEHQKELATIKVQFNEVSLLSVQLEELSIKSEVKSSHLESDQVKVQLPSIKLPRFSGNSLEWLSFRDLFQSLVDNRATLSDSEKHYYLRTSLCDEALSVINHLPMDASNYKGAWKLLKARYDNSRALTDVYLDRIYNLPHINNNSDIRRDFYDPLRESVQALGKISLPIDQWSYLLLFLILKKLPIRLRETFEERYGKAHESLPTFSQLLELLDEHCRLRETLSTSPTPSGKSDPSKRPFRPKPRERVVATAAQSSEPARRFNQVTSCSYCYSDYTLYRCKDFLQLHPYKCKVWAAKKSICEICLRFHANKPCQSKGWCKHCNSDKHNTLLCYNDQQTRQPRGQTTRSISWRDKIEKKKQEKKDDASASYDFKAAQETAPVDEPLYDLGPHTSSIPVQEVYSQNFEFSGFIDQVERSYEVMRGIDPRLPRRMPFSMYQHSMCTILNSYILDLALENGERKLGSGKCQDLLPEDLCIPENLYHFLANIGNTTTVNGEEIKINIPDAAVPQPQADDIPAGSFGAVNAENHNVYECYISPLVTMNRVLNSRRAPGHPEIPPLPAAMIPDGGIPTENLLGHGPPDLIDAEARHRIEGFDFPEGDSEAARRVSNTKNTSVVDLR